MKTSTKMLALFASAIILSFVQLVITYKLQSNILDNTRQIKDVEAPLGVMVEQVIGYDAMLTGSIYTAFLHVQNGERDIKEHEARYDEIRIKLDDLLDKGARILVTQSKRPQEIKDITFGYLKTLDELNLKLVDLETRAFGAMEKNDLVTANSLIVGGNFDKYNEKLYQNYLDWAGVENNLNLGLQKDIIKDSQQISYLNLVFSLMITLLLTVIMFMFRTFMSKTISEKNKKEGV